MVGAILIAAAMVLAVPVGVMLGGAVWSAVFGTVASDDAAARFGSDG